ncbi:MAG: SPOR domain-containing protein [Spirosomaceae bacterium]|jgi:rare lipoprotein A|nr:SPOR domain-containing protein [Spirosomataceae bacterium]
MKSLFATTKLTLGMVLIAAPIVFAQDLTASLADDLSVTTTRIEDEKNPSSTLNKKVKLTNLDNGKSVVVRISDRTKSNDKIAYLSRGASQEAGMVESGKMKVRIQEMQPEDEVDRFWAVAEPTKKVVKEKEVDIETTKISGFSVNHVYDLTGSIKELEGYGLQLGAFTQLKAAKDFASKIANKGEAEQEKLYIQVSKSENRPMVYRVIYGFFEEENAAKDTQKRMITLGYSALVKGFN